MKICKKAQNSFRDANFFWVQLLEIFWRFQIALEAYGRLQTVLKTFKSVLNYLRAFGRFKQHIEGSGMRFRGIWNLLHGSQNFLEASKLL